MCKASLIAICRAEPERIQHCLKVSEVATTIGQSLNTSGFPVNMGVVHTVATLNDIAKSQPKYDIVGGRIPQEPGFSKLGDVTGAVKRTLLRPKTEGEAVEFNVPALVSEELWQKASKALQARGRGRGKQGKSILALLRGRIFCPRCGKPMVVRRKSGKQVQYYHCSRRYRSWSPDRCTYRDFVPGSWDEMVWDCAYALLVQDDWLEEYLNSVENQVESVEKLIKSEQ